MLTLWVLPCALQTFLAVLRKTPLPTRTSCPAEVGLVERFISCGGVTAKALIRAAVDGDPTVSPEGALSSAGCSVVSLFPLLPHPCVGLLWRLHCGYSGSVATEYLHVSACLAASYVMSRGQDRVATRPRHNGLLRPELRP